MKLCMGMLTQWSHFLQSFDVEVFSLTADGPTVMDKVRCVPAEDGGVLGLTHIFHKAVGHSLDTKGVKEPVALSAAISHAKESNILTQDLALMVCRLELISRLL